jgi:hypothetical protein
MQKMIGRILREENKMGIYYKIINLTKEEVIDLCEITNIKYSCMCSWSLQMATLSVLLGFNPYRAEVNLYKYVGRWKGDKVAIVNDGSIDLLNAMSHNWPDIGIDILNDLYTANELDKWFSYNNWGSFDLDYTKYYFKRKITEEGKIK